MAFLKTTARPAAGRVLLLAACVAALLARPVRTRTVLTSPDLSRIKADDPRFELQGEYAKPWLDPYVDVEGALREVLPPRPSRSFSAWPEGELPANCREHFAQHALDQREFGFSVYNVTYDDCGVPWTFCRHEEAVVSIEEMVDTFGRLPIRMRELVRSVIGLPSGPKDDHSVAWSVEGDIVVRACCWNLHVLTHEASHILDSSGHRSRLMLQSRSRRPWLVGPASGQSAAAAAGEDKPLYSSTQRWRDAEKHDDAVVSWYSRVTWAEHFAEMAGQGLLEALRPGRLRELSGEAADKLRHQAEAWVEDWADLVLDKGTCVPAQRPATPKAAAASP